MTRSELISLLKKQIGPGFEEVTIGDTGLGEFINDAYNYAVSAITDINPNYFMKSANLTLVADQQEYTLASDFEKMLMVNILWETSGTWYRVLPLNEGIGQLPVINRTTDNQGHDLANPRYYIYGPDGTRKMGFVPIPTGAVTNGVEYWYIYTPEDLTENTDEPAIPKRFHRMLIDGAYSRYLAQDDEHAASQQRWLMFERRVNQMVETISQDQVDEPKYVSIVGNTDLYEMY